MILAMRKFAGAFAIAALMSGTALPVLAQNAAPATGQELSHKERHEKWKSMTPEQREAFKKERREKWNAMSQEEKLQMIEKKRTERMKRHQEKWDSMSPEEKINFVEKRWERKSKYHEKHMHGEGKAAQ